MILKKKHANVNHIVEIGKTVCRTAPVFLELPITLGRNGEVDLCHRLVYILSTSYLLSLVDCFLHRREWCSAPCWS